MSSANERVPDWQLEKLARGELSPAEADSLRAQLRARGEEARLEALLLSDAGILEAHPPAQVAREIERRAAGRAATDRARARQERRPWMVAFSLATVGAAAVLVLRTTRVDPFAPGAGGASDTEALGETIGIKGLQPSLRIYRRTATGSERLAPGATVRAGDTLQVRYVGAGRRFGVIASIDGRGVVTLHVPEVAGPAVALGRDGERSAPHAYELDASPGFERFELVTSDAPFDTETVVRALAKGMPLPSSLATTRVTLTKEIR